MGYAPDEQTVWFSDGDERYHRDKQCAQIHKDGKLQSAVEDLRGDMMPASLECRSVCPQCADMGF